MSVVSPYVNTPPMINRDQLPAVVGYSLPQWHNADQSNRKSLSILDVPTRRYLKPLDQNPQGPLSSEVVDLEYVRSIFLFPLNYVRVALVAAYQWAQGLLPLEGSPSPKVDLYV